jgi:hypothetical protein
LYHDPSVHVFFPNLMLSVCNHRYHWFIFIACNLHCRLKKTHRGEKNNLNHKTRLRIFAKPDRVKKQKRPVAYSVHVK